MAASRAWKEISKELGELVGNSEIDDKLKQPFLYEAEVCARNQLAYATIVMLGLCAEAYAKLLAKKMEGIDKTLIPHFGKKAFKDRNSVLEKLEKISKPKGTANELFFKEIVNIFHEMQLLTIEGERTNPLHKLNFNYLAEIRNEYAHPNWIEVKETVVLEYLHELRKIIIHNVDSVRFTSASKLVEFIIENAQASPSSFICLIPLQEFNSAAERVFQSLLTIGSGDVARLANFLIHLKKSAPLEERGKIETYFLERLAESIRGKIEKKPSDLIYLIDWNGSEEFCNQCAGALLDWLENQITLTPMPHEQEDSSVIIDYPTNIGSLLEVAKHLEQNVPESYSARANNAVAAIQQHIPENVL